MTAPASFSYQWKTTTPGGITTNATGTGATAQNYLVAQVDAGNTLSCVVTGINTAGQTVVTTASTGVVIGTPNVAPVFTADSPPATATVGTAYSYQLVATGATSFVLASGSFPGITVSTAGFISGTPTSSGTVAIIVDAVNAYGTTASPTLTITVAAAASGAPTVTSAAVITGTLVVNNQLTASAVFSGAISYSYQWYFNGIATTGTQFSTYTPSAAGTVYCIVSGTNTAGTTSSTSPTVTIAPASATATRFVGFTMDVTNRSGMVGKNLTTADAFSGPRTNFPGGASTQSAPNLPTNFESFTDYLSVFPWPPIIGCFMNQNDPITSISGNVAALYFGAGAGTSTSSGGYPTYQGQLTDPGQLTGGPFENSPYKNIDGSAAIPSIPIISWDLGGTSLTAIAAGNFDTSTLIPAAQACKAWPASNPGNPAYSGQTGGQVIIRFCHEMNGSWSGYSPGCTVAVNGAFGGQPAGTTCADFVAMWQHVVKVFAEQGATNARWLWCPNVMGSSAATPSQSGWSDGSGTTKLLYPGDAYVDYVGLDGYNYTANSSTWQIFSKVFQTSYNIIYSGDSFTNGPITTTKPMILGEIGCWETDELSGAGSNTKGTWFSAIPAAVEATMPNIIGICYWYENPGSSGNQTSTEYYITSSSGSVAGWNALSESWNGRPPVIQGITAALA
jgi:Glycosyl hydrolase family 26